MSTDSLIQPVLFKFGSIANEVPAELAAVVAKFNALPGISASFSPHGSGIGGAKSKDEFLALVDWADKTEGYTHCLLVVANSHASLKAYLHSDAHLVEWFSAVKPFAQAPPLVFDNVLSAAAIAGIAQRGAEGLCAAEGVSAPASGSGAAAAGGEDEYAALSDEEIVAMVRGGKLKDHQLESKLKDCERAVGVRRLALTSGGGQAPLSVDQGGPESAVAGLAKLPFQGYCYNQVFGANCEVVVGYVPLPCGLVGPLLLNSEDGKGFSPYYVPMATTEGCLVASTNRGAKAVTQSGGCTAVVLKDGITRAPCLLLPSATEAAKLKLWVEDPANWSGVSGAFEATTSFGKLKSVMAVVAGRNVFVRLVCFAGDAMGMNMVSKGCLAVIEHLKTPFPNLRLIAISGNVCSDKKPAAINWIEGRGKSVVCEALIPSRIVKDTLKTTVRGMVEVATRKNLVGSAMAGSVGGFNAHAANVVSAVFLACGQDPAQVVESANCITLFEAIPSPTGSSDDGEDDDLHISVTMPSIEVGTVGGGTSLPAQAACLEIMGVRGASQADAGEAPGDRARKLGTIVAAAVLAGELSLMAALASNDLVKSHMQHNRKKT